MTEIPDQMKESLKKVAEKAAKAAQLAMSDKPPNPVELGGRVEKLLPPGTLISPPPTPAPPAGVPLPGLPGGLPKG